MNCPNCHAQVPAGTTFCPECGTRLQAPSQTLRVLQGRYELVARLGQGGMGAVYLASDRRLSTVRWAVKEMSDTLITSPLERQSAADAFKYEAELLARLGHPNLPRVTDHFTEDGKNYLVMELVPGETIQAYSQREGLPRPLSEVQEWTSQLCDVLGYLHRQTPPIIFRDLKPANVMRTPEGALKLIDFGIARLFKPGQSRDTQAYGTMGYSAPEQYGRGQTDARSDVYSLAVMIHHLLTGHDPATTPFRLPPANQLNPAVPQPVAAILTQATDNNPDERFPTLAAFQDALLGSGQLVQRQSITVPALAPIASVKSAGGAGSLTDASSTAVAETTGLARAALWVGSISLVWSVFAGVLLALGGFGADAESLLSGLGVIFGLPPLGLGPLALLLALIALINTRTSATLKGRRHAAIGLAGGMVTLLICCGMSVAFGVNSPTSERYQQQIEVAFSGLLRAEPNPSS